MPKTKKQPTEKTEPKVCKIPVETTCKLSVLMNGESYSVCLNTKDEIKDAINALKPETLYTEVYVMVEEQGVVTDRKLTLIQGKKLFNDELFMDIFITNLLLS